MTACCDTDVTVFGHTQPDCPHTQLPAWEAGARLEHIRCLEQLAARPGPAPAGRRPLSRLIARSRT